VAKISFFLREMAKKSRPGRWFCPRTANPLPPSFQGISLWDFQERRRWSFCDLAITRGFPPPSGDGDNSSVVALLSSRGPRGDKFLVSLMLVPEPSFFASVSLVFNREWLANRSQRIGPPLLPILIANLFSRSDSWKPGFWR